MRFRSFCLIGLVSLLLSMVVFGQVASQQKEAPKKPAIDQDKFDKAHEGIFSKQGDKAAEAGRLTAEMSKALPAAGANTKIARKNFIDEQIFGRIERDRIPHSALSTDEEFLRRVYLDATGLLPTPDKVREFLADKDPQKRDKLIDTLIGTDSFADQ